MSVWRLYPRKTSQEKVKHSGRTKNKRKLGWLKSPPISRKIVVCHCPSPDCRGHRHFRLKSWPQKAPHEPHNASRVKIYNVGLAENLVKTLNPMVYNHFSYDIDIS